MNEKIVTEKVAVEKVKVLVDDTTSILVSTPQALGLGEQLREGDPRGFFQGHRPAKVRVSGPMADKDGNPIGEKDLLFQGSIYVCSSRKKPGLRFFLPMRQHSVLLQRGETVEVEVVSLDI